MHVYGCMGLLNAGRYTGACIVERSLVSLGIGTSNKLNTAVTTGQWHSTIQAPVGR